jgi:hypothetical protein
MCLDAFIFK